MDESNAASVGRTMRITHPMLDIYCEFAGDIDGYARAGRSAQRQIINDAQWMAISTLLQDLFLLVSGKATLEYAQRLRTQLSEAAADASVESRLMDWVKQAYEVQAGTKYP